MAASGTSTDLDEVAQDLAAALDRHVRDGELLGLSWTIGVGGEHRTGAAGHLDTARTRPVEANTIYRISSMSKPVTAAAALLLVDDGVIGLDDPVDQLLPELADRRVLTRPDGPVEQTEPAHRPVTVADLLTFRLGLGMDFTAAGPTPLDEALGALGLGVAPPAPQAAPAPGEWMRRLGTVPLQYQPGERWLYHTSAQVLGVLVARAAGMPLEEWLRRRILEPVGMPDTAFSVPAGKLGRFGPCFGEVDPDTGDRAVYDPADGQWSRPPAFPGGGDGLVSTAGDFHPFARMLLGGGALDGLRVLSEDAVRAMTTNQLTDEQYVDLAGAAAGHGDVLVGAGAGLPRGRRGRSALSRCRPATSQDVPQDALLHAPELPVGDRVLRPVDPLVGDQLEQPVDPRSQCSRGVQVGRRGRRPPRRQVGLPDLVLARSSGVVRRPGGQLRGVQERVADAGIGPS
jgi:CubicO group peptidase (beta-lactamase class C family)